jgi:hypothetical protein
MGYIMDTNQNTPSIQIDANAQVNLSLIIQDVQVIFDGLSELKAKIALPLIQKLNEQVAKQLAELQTMPANVE